jgi:hypothetical protein
VGAPKDDRQRVIARRPAVLVALARISRRCSPSGVADTGAGDHGFHDRVDDVDRQTRGRSLRRELR